MIKELDVLSYLTDYDPMQYEPQMPYQNVNLTCLVDEMVEAGDLTGKGPQVAEASWLDHENNNPDVEWMLDEPWMPARNGLNLVQSSSSTPVDCVAQHKPARRVSLGRNMEHVSNPGQEDTPLVESQTTLPPPRMTGSFVGLLLLLAAHTHCQTASPTDPHSLLRCPSCGSVQDLTVC